MDQCCPSPDFPVIDPLEHPEALKQRKRLRWLFNGQIVVILCKVWVFGLLNGIFQLINLWMVYNAWATLHWCQVIVFVIFSAFDLLIMLFKIAKANAMLDTFSLLLFYVILIYLVIACYVSYQAYTKLKEIYV
jgi:hypothetical protein